VLLLLLVACGSTFCSLLFLSLLLLMIFCANIGNVDVATTFIAC
jgi:hypothetical protein